MESTASTGAPRRPYGASPSDPDPIRDPGAAGAGAPAGHGVAALMRKWVRDLPPSDDKRRLAESVAERVEDGERRLGSLMGRPLRERGWDGLAEHVERNPVATLAGALVAVWVLNRTLD